MKCPDDRVVRAFLFCCNFSLSLSAGYDKWVLKSQKSIAGKIKREIFALPNGAYGAGEREERLWRSIEKINFARVFGSQKRPLTFADPSAGKGTKRGGRSLRKTLKINFGRAYCRLKNLSYLCTPFGREGEKTERKPKGWSLWQRPQMRGTKFFEVM